MLASRMLMRLLPFAFATACALNGYFALYRTFSFERQHLALSYFGLIGGVTAFLLAIALGITLLRHAREAARTWTKYALVFLALSPTAYATLVWPSGLEASRCLLSRFGCATADAQAYRETMLANVAQSEFVMALVALAAFYCSTQVVARVCAALGVQDTNCVSRPA